MVLKEPVFEKINRTNGSVSEFVAPHVALLPSCELENAEASDDYAVDPIVSREGVSDKQVPAGHADTQALETLFNNLSAEFKSHVSHSFILVEQVAQFELQSSQILLASVSV